MAVGVFKKHTLSIKILIFLGIFLLGALTDHTISTFFATPLVLAPIRQKGFTYASPLLYCRYPKVQNGQVITKLQTNLQKYIDSITSAGTAQNVSIYFHDPTTGEWTSVNGTQQYPLASLIKVPLLMMVYDKAEQNKSLLSKKLLFDGNDADQEENFKPTPQDQIKKGQKYTVDDLVSRMIIYSDNNAMNLLTSEVKLNAFNDNLEQLNFPPIQGNSQSDIFMTVGKYATFFRILYNATYLTPEMSEKALKLLTQTTFTMGIVAGVPKNIQVAHKFGERSYADSNTRVLHDCGIVYYPNHPYLLCIMTKGNNYQKLASVIQTISKKTYDSIKASYND